MTIKNTAIQLACAGLLSATTLATVHADDGQTIYEDSCTGCHGLEVFTRPNRLVGNMDELRTRVTQCGINVEAQWFDEEVDAVIDYLNQNFYKF